MGKIICEDCQPGKYAGMNSKISCDACQDGWFTTLNGSKSCEAAPKGYVSDAVTKAFVVPCREGKYSSVSGSPSCTFVRPGFFAQGLANVEPKACSSGSFTKVEGAGRCALCPLGYFGSGTGLTACSPVPPGHYSSIEGRWNASRCIPGTYSPGTTVDVHTEEVTPAIECFECPPGTMSFVGSPSCDLCEVGKFSPNSGTAVCKNCLSGTFSVAGKIICTSCPAGYIAASDKQSKCSKCDFGKFNSDLKMKECKRCSVGKYAMDEGSIACKLCESGRYASDEGLLACRECDPNKVSTTGAMECTTCPAKSWTKLESGASICTECKLGEVFPTNATGRCYHCEADTYSTQPGEDILKTCHPCPFGARCTGGASLQARIGFWRSSFVGLKFNACPYAAACLGAPKANGDDELNKLVVLKQVDEDERNEDNEEKEINSNSSIGLYYEGCDPRYGGVLCLTCAKGYGKQGKECVKCMDDVAADVAITMTRLVVLTILVLLYVEKSRRSGGSTKSTPFATMIKISLAHMQIISLALSYPMVWPAEVEYMLRMFEALGYVDALMPLGCAMPSSNIYVKSALYMIAPILIFFTMTFVDMLRYILCGFGNGTEKKKKKGEKKEKEKESEVLDADGYLPETEGKQNDTFDKQAEKIKETSDQEKKKKTKATSKGFCTAVRFIPVYFLTTGLLYPTLAKSAFKVFTCTSMYFYSAIEQTSILEYRLLADPNVVCFDNR